VKGALNVAKNTLQGSKVRLMGIVHVEANLLNYICDV
jgi:hypothetical protein